MTGKDIAARTQGTVESILLARASSMAPALLGFGNILVNGWRAEVRACTDDAAASVCNEDGERIGLENESR